MRMTKPQLAGRGRGLEKGQLDLAWNENFCMGGHGKQPGTLQDYVGLYAEELLTRESAIEQRRGFLEQFDVIEGFARLT